MKKKRIKEKDKNQFIWEEFVLKNSIKKKFQAAVTLFPIKIEKRIISL